MYILGFLLLVDILVICVVILHHTRLYYLITYARGSLMGTAVETQ